jgi:hypothetical protein
MEYKTLPCKFTKFNTSFNQAFREGDVAVFERLFKTGGTSWETVIIQKCNGGEVYGNKIEPMETLPGNSLWGKAGFTYPDKKSAMEKAKKLLVLQEKKQDDKDNGIVAKRGRKTLVVDFKFPSKEFVVKDVATLNKVSVAYAYNKIKVNPNVVVTKRVSGKRGKPTVFYNLMKLEES